MECNNGASSACSVREWWGCRRSFRARFNFKMLWFYMSMRKGSQSACLRGSKLRYSSLLVYQLRIRILKSNHWIILSEIWILIQFMLFWTLSKDLINFSSRILGILRVSTASTRSHPNSPFRAPLNVSSRIHIKQDTCYPSKLYQSFFTCGTVAPGSALQKITKLW